jgi:hypothetical protein
MIKKEVVDYVLKQADKGWVVFNTIEGTESVPVEEFIKQPADGILYDLNRSPEVVLTFIKNDKWLNDYAVGMTIKALKEEIERLEHLLR